MVWCHRLLACDNSKVIAVGIGALSIDANFGKI